MNSFKIVLIIFLSVFLAGCARAETPADVPETSSPPGSSEDAGTGDSVSESDTDASAPAPDAVPPDSASEEEDPDGVFTVNKITYELQEKWKIQIDAYDFKTYWPADIYGAYTDLRIEFKTESFGQDLTGIPAGEILATELAGFASAEGVSVLSTEETTVLNCPGLVVSGKKLREKLDEVSHDPTVYWGRTIYFVRDGGVYSFSFWTPSEMFAENYAAELSEALEYAYENPNAYAEQDAERKTMRAYTVHNVSVELSQAWKLNFEDEKGNYKLYSSKSHWGASMYVSFNETINGQELTELSPDKAMELFLSRQNIDKYITILSREERTFGSCQGLVEYTVWDDHGETNGARGLNCKIYITKDGGVYVFNVVAAPENADELFAELEELVENARFG